MIFYRRNSDMKKYEEPELEIVSFEVEDFTNFGGDNEISAAELFPTKQIDW